MQDQVKISEHLTAVLIRDYRTRALSPETLLAVTAHLAACPECRAKVAPETEVDRLAEALGGGHLTYEQLENLASGGSQGVEHARTCAICAAEVADLKAFIETRPDRIRKTAWPGLRILVPALVCLVLVVIAIRLRPSVAPHVSAPPPAAAPALALKDATPAEQAELENAIRTGRLPAPDLPEALQRHAVMLLGDKTLSPSDLPISALAPAGTVISSDTPVFRWRAVEGAADFCVAVYDSNFERVLSSPVLQTTEWTPQQPLRRGQTYTWTVTARIAGKSVTVPHAPEPEALFHVISQTDWQKLESLRTANPPSPLRLALAAARLGLTSEAAEALQQLEKDNPQSPLPARWRENLRR